MHQRSRSLLLLAIKVLRYQAATLVAASIIGGAPWTFSADAATFTVEPTQIALTNRASSVLLTLRNESTDSLRFELSVFKWTQSSSGEMQLEPTEDIVFFPALLTLAPGESRRVRVGSATEFDANEKTYRIFVEELPPLNRETSGVRVLTRMGIPIFMKPAKEVASATLNNLGQKSGKLFFTLSNEGTVHIVPSDIRVRGFAGSATAVDNRLDGWYILAGGRRDFDMIFPAAECARITSVTVDVQFGSESVQERLQTPNGVCRR
jgi:fimbrial chaperone protein